MRDLRFGRQNWDYHQNRDINTRRQYASQSLTPCLSVCAVQADTLELP